MNIVLLAGSGTTYMPQNYVTITKLFFDLGSSLKKLGNNIKVIGNTLSGAKIPGCMCIDKKMNLQELTQACGFEPDVLIVWNPHNDGSQHYIELAKTNNKTVVVGELGIFGRYDRTCYFEVIGKTCRTQLHDINYKKFYNKLLFQQLLNKYKKPRAYHDFKYYFVPLQDDKYTTQLKCKINTNQQLLDWCKNNCTDSVMYKNHPKVQIDKSLITYDFLQVTGDVHSYIPYTEMVVSINSNVVFETLLYHSNIITFDDSIAIPNFRDEIERQSYVCYLFRNQLRWDELLNPNYVMQKHFYKALKELQ